MMAIDLATEAAIRQLYFVQRCRLDVIGDVLQLPRSTIRRVLVLSGGAPLQPSRGPFRKESDS